MSRQQHSPLAPASGTNASLGLVAAALALILLLVGPPAGPVAAVDPTATPGAGGDPRSSGEGPGFAGDPLLAIGGVLVVGLGSVLLTLGYVRLTDRRRS